MEVLRGCTEALWAAESCGSRALVGRVNSGEQKVNGMAHGLFTFPFTLLFTVAPR